MYNIGVNMTKLSNDKVKFNGWFGINFKRLLTKNILNVKKVDNLFISVGSMEIVIYEFFLLELKYVLETVIVCSPFSVNVKALQEVIKRIDETMESSKSDVILDYSLIEKEMKFKMLPHQVQAFEGYTDIKNRLGYRGYLGNFSVGSGKTFMSLAITVALQVDKVLIVVPNHTIDTVWIRALTKEIYKVPQEIYTKHDIQNKKKYNGEKYIIMNHEGLDKVYDFIEELGNNIAVIVDESHNFISLKSKRTQQLVDIVNKTGTDNILLMSGTPIKGKVTELIPILQMLDKRFNSTIQKRFEVMYRGGGFLVKALQARYNTYSKYIATDELDLPEMTTKNIEVKIPNGEDYLLKTINKNMLAFIKARTAELEGTYPIHSETYLKLYNKYKTLLRDAKRVSNKEFLEYEKDIEDILKYYERNALMMIPDVIVRANKFEKMLMTNMDSEEKYIFKNVKSIYKYISLKVTGEALANVVMKARSDCYTDMVKHIDFDTLISSTIKKVVIFTSYLKVASKTYDILKDKDYTPARVYGEHTKYTKQSITEFLENKLINPIIASFKSMGSGITLVNANVVLMLNKPFRSIEFEQASARVHRIGQDLPCFIYVFSLDTGEDKNITDRDTDIVNFFKDEIGKITGVTRDIDLDGTGISNEDIVMESIYEEITDVVSDEMYDVQILTQKLIVKRNKNIIDAW